MGAGNQVEGSPCRRGAPVYRCWSVGRGGAESFVCGLCSLVVASFFSVRWEAESSAESKEAEGGVKSLRREKKRRNNNVKE